MTPKRQSVVYIGDVNIASVAMFICDVPIASFGDPSQLLSFRYSNTSLERTVCCRLDSLGWQLCPRRYRWFGSWSPPSLLHPAGFCWDHFPWRKGCSGLVSAGSLPSLHQPKRHLKDRVTAVAETEALAFSTAFSYFHKLLRPLVLTGTLQLDSNPSAHTPWVALLTPYTQQSYFWVKKFTTYF